MNVKIYDDSNEKIAALNYVRSSPILIPYKNYMEKILIKNQAK
jgi:hypothetical protein